MRKTKKSVVYDLFNPVTDFNFENAFYVIGGGFIFQQETKRTREKLSSILNKCVDYMWNNITKVVPLLYSKDNGYPDDLTKSTKSALKGKNLWSWKCNFWRNKMWNYVSRAILFEFDANKRRIILILRERLENEHFIVKQTVEDADTLIVHSNINIANSTKFDVKTLIFWLYFQL